MKKILLLFFIIIIFQINLIGQCFRETSKNSEFGEISSHKSNGWFLFNPTSDEFNSSNIDRSKWELADSTCHPVSPKAFFKSDNCFISDGKMIIKAISDTQQVGCGNFNYSSGYIQSKVPFRYGLIEVKVKFPHEKALNGSIWTFGSGWHSPVGDTLGHEARYDEIDLFECVPYLNSNKVFRQNLIRVIKTDPPLPDCHEYSVGQIDCKRLQYNNSYADDYIILGVEWFPNEINFFVNGVWSNGFRYTTNNNYISPIDYDGKNNIFTCLDFTNAVEQKIQMSLFLSDYFQQPDLSENLEIDWIRTYKLMKGINNWVPTTWNPLDNEISKFHSSYIYLGGMGRNIIIPENTKATLWSGSSISFDRGFEIKSNCEIEFRTITSDQNLILFPTITNK